MKFTTILRKKGRGSVFNLKATNFIKIDGADIIYFMSYIKIPINKQKSNAQYVRMSRMFNTKKCPVRENVRFRENVQYIKCPVRENVPYVKMSHTKNGSYVKMSRT